MKMSVRCEGCALLGSIRCRECMEGGFCFYKPLVELRPPNQELRRPYTPPTAEVTPITNEMHLHSLDSKALAAFLVEYESGTYCKGDPRCEADLEEDRLIPIERCHECALAWLKAPYVPKEAANA